MADNESNVIQLDDEFDIFQDVVKKEETPKEEKPKSILEKLLKLSRRYKKITILVAFFFGVFLIAIIFLISHLLIKDEVAPPPTTIAPVQEVVIEKGGDLIADSKGLDLLIQKANFLYTSGYKLEALDIYGKISNYSEKLSNYNLGVAQMQEKAYEEALQSFQKAIELGEDRVISSLNAAVCSLHLKDSLKFKYYIDLAQTYLPYAGNIPLYSYLYGLVHYYQGNYLEAISPLIHQSSPYYKEQNDYLLASLYTYFQRDYQAIDVLSKYNAEPKNWLNLSLLYARIGDYPQAHQLLTQYIEAYGKNIQTEFPLALIKLKLTQFESAGKIFANYAKEDLIAQNPYPIKIALKDKFFDINVAQKRFWTRFNDSKLNSYKFLFYFAPYQVFDAKEVFNIIQEGEININIENLQEAKEVLLRGKTISRVNRNIAQAIIESINGNIRNANALLKAVVEKYPNHSILHYNLGLNYAQMGDYNNGYHHFLRSFHLNPKDIKAGIFALICANLTNRNAERLGADIEKEITNMQENKAESQFILALLNFTRDGIPQPLDLELLKESKSSIYYALDFAQSVILRDQESLIRSSSELVKLMPNDPITNLVYLLSLNYNDNPKELSLKLQDYFKNDKIYKESIYYGPAVVREFYIGIAHIVGTLHYVEQDLDFRLISEQKDARGVIQALALTYIYLQEFEKAFTLYNSLIDDFKEEDPQTLFLASVAAIGAGYAENATALLQLSKLESPTSRETKIALGILYLQEKNFHAASRQFTTIGNDKHPSEYFDFKIDSKNLLEGVDMN